MSYFINRNRNLLKIKDYYIELTLNTKKGFESLNDWIIKHQIQSIPVVICMEATGIYHENCAYYLYEKGFNVSVVLPNKAKKYLECLGLKSKNDSTVDKY